MRRHLLFPLGIWNSYTARTDKAYVSPNEVRYRNVKIEPSEMSPARPWKATYYGGANLQRQAGGDGWVMSAPAMVKLLASIDHPGLVLSSDEIDRLLAPTTFGPLTLWRGWDTRTTRSGGVLAYTKNGAGGGTGRLVYRTDGTVVVIMTSGGIVPSSDFANDIVEGITAWPRRNLFAEMGVTTF